MFLKLAALFIIVPTVELIVLIFIGSWMGPIPTTLLIIGTGLLGTWLTRREGLGVLRRLRTDLKQGMPPAQGLAEGALILAGGLLLLTPGIFTDLTGFSLIIPWSRKRIAPALLRYLTARFMPTGTNSAQWKVHFDAKTSTPEEQPSKAAADPFDHPIA